MDLPSEYRKEKEIHFIKFYLNKLKDLGIPEKDLNFDNAFVIYRLTLLLNVCCNCNA
jgi:hypothetical protein